MYRALFLDGRSLIRFERPSWAKESFSYSLMVYYTPEFAAATDNIEEFIDKMIEETNQGYSNSKLPITVTKFCSELATISEHCVNPGSLLDTFTKMKGSHSTGFFSFISYFYSFIILFLEELEYKFRWEESYSALRNTADAATLLVLNQNHSSCGEGFFAAYRTKKSFSWVKKNCAFRSGMWSLGHELGHNLGAAHNARDSGTSLPRGHGYFIKKGKYQIGLRSIMAYPRKGYEIRTNYYSNPDVIHPLTGTPTGDWKSNNAAIIRMNIGKLAAIGDESGSCKRSFNWRDPLQPWRKMAAKLSAATGICLMVS